MKNKIFAVVIALMLFSPVYSLPETADTTENIPAVEETVSPEENISEEAAQPPENSDITENSVLNKELASTPYKPPISKRKLAKKFLLAMLGVAGSSLIIFAGLSIYNRIRESFLAAGQDTGSESSSSLDTPDNITDAVKTFMDKTRWG